MIPLANRVLLEATFDLAHNIQEMDISKSFDKVWKLIITQAKKLSKKSIEVADGFKVMATGYETAGTPVPGVLMGKSISDPKSGRVISISSDGKTSVLLEF